MLSPQSHIESSAALMHFNTLHLNMRCISIIAVCDYVSFYAGMYDFIFI